MKKVCGGGARFSVFSWGKETPDALEEIGVAAKFSGVEWAAALCFQARNVTTKTSFKPVTPHAFKPKGKFT